MSPAAYDATPPASCWSDDDIDMYAPRSAASGIADDRACAEIMRAVMATKITMLIAMTNQSGVTPRRVK